MTQQDDEGSSAAAPWLAGDARRTWITAAASVPIALVAWLVFAFLLAGSDPVELVLAIAFVTWTLTCALSAALIFAAFGRASADDLRRWLVGARGGSGDTGWAIVGSVIAVVGVTVLSAIGEARTTVLVVSGIAVVVASLGLTITAFAVRYARAAIATGGIEFPGGAAPTFTDFVYLSVQVTTTFSTADAQITDTATRRIVTVHSLIGFAFSTVIIALLVGVVISPA